MSKSSVSRLSFFVVLVIFAGAAAADLSPEQRNRMRGEMREQWSRMTPDEREALKREHPAIDPLRAEVSDRSRQLSTEDHHHLRKQLRDLSAMERR